MFVLEDILDLARAIQAGADARQIAAADHVCTAARRWVRDHPVQHDMTPEGHARWLLAISEAAAVLAARTALKAAA